MNPMGTISIKIPLVTWRDGRPRFFPGEATRRLGYKGEDLRHGKAGPWFTLDETIAWSKKRQAEVEKRRAELAAGDASPRETVKAVRAARAAGLATVGQVVEDFLGSAPMLGRAIVTGRQRREPLSDNTVRAYRGSARLLSRLDSGFAWLEPAADMTGKALSGLLDRVEQLHGLAQARAVRALVSVAFSHGRRQGTVHHNPIDQMETRLPVLEPDVRPASIEEADALIRGIDALGYPDIADVLAAGIWTGQRQNDRLALTEEQVTAEGILFSPSKKKRTGDRLLVPVARGLAARLEAAAERRRGWKVLPLKDRPVFWFEAGQIRWQADWYRKCVRVMLHALAFGTLETLDGRNEATREAVRLLGHVDIRARLEASGIPLMPSLASYADKHGRDTCLSWLALAGADKLEIAGFSGHAFGQQEKILKHYVVIPPEFARRGLAKLEAWHAGRLADLRRKAV